MTRNMLQYTFWSYLKVKSINNSQDYIAMLKFKFMNINYEELNMFVYREF